jgi:hypothetical protein
MVVGVDEGISSSAVKRVILRRGSDRQPVPSCAPVITLY